MGDMHNDYATVSRSDRIHLPSYNPHFHCKGFFNYGTPDNYRLVAVILDGRHLDHLAEPLPVTHKLYSQDGLVAAAQGEWATGDFKRVLGNMRAAVDMGFDFGPPCLSYEEALEQVRCQQIIAAQQESNDGAWNASLATQTRVDRPLTATQAPLYAA